MRGVEILVSLAHLGLSCMHGAEIGSGRPLRTYVWVCEDCLEQAACEPSELWDSRGNIGIMEKKTTGVIWVYIGIMEKKWKPPC